MKHRSDILFLCVIFIVALFSCIAYDIFLRHHYAFYRFPSSDVQYYLNWAKTILTQPIKAQKIFWGIPFYPYFLAAVLQISAGKLFIVRLCQFILHALSSVLVFFIANKLFDKRIGKISAFLVAINPILIYYTWLLMPTTLITFMGLLLTYLLVLYPSSQNPKEWFLLGLIWGIAIIADGKFLIFFLLLSLWNIGKRDQKRRGTPIPLGPVKTFLALTGGVILILGALTIRNFIVFHDLLIISPQSGLSFFAGNNPSATGGYRNPIFIRPSHTTQDIDQRIFAEQSLKKKLAPSEVCRFWWGRGLRFIYQDPIAYLNLLRKKFSVFFIDAENTYDIDLIFQKKFIRKFNINPNRLIISLALIGILLSIWQKRSSPEILLLLLSQLFFSLLFFVNYRHKTTILPFFILYEAYAISAILEYIRLRKMRYLMSIIMLIGLFWAILKPARLPKNFINYTYWSKMAPILAENGKKKNAEKYYRYALAYAPLDTNTLYNMGTLYASQKQWQKAIPYFQRVIVLNPLEVNAWYNLAYCHQKTGDWNAALSEYKKVLHLAPSSKDALYQLARLYKEKGDCAQMRKYYTALVNQDPSLQQEIYEEIRSCISKPIKNSY